MAKFFETTLPRRLFRSQEVHEFALVYSSLAFLTLAGAGGVVVRLACARGDWATAAILLAGLACASGSVAVGGIWHLTGRRLALRRRQGLSSRLQALAKPTDPEEVSAVVEEVQGLLTLWEKDRRWIWFLMGSFWCLGLFHSFLLFVPNWSRLLGG